MISFHRQGVAEEYHRGRRGEVGLLLEVSGQGLREVDVGLDVGLSGAIERVDQERGERGEAGGGAHEAEPDAGDALDGGEVVLGGRGHRNGPECVAGIIVVNGKASPGSTLLGSASTRGSRLRANRENHMAQRRIYLVRHGVAEDYSDSGRDFDRRLTAEGREKMERAGAGLAALGVEVDLLVSSPLVRAIQTADALAPAYPSVRREVWDELACGVDEIALTARVEEVDAGTNVMLVGHEPDIGEILAYWLTGRTSGFYTRVRKGSVSCIVAGSLPPNGNTMLEWMMTAKQLGRAG